MKWLSVLGIIILTTFIILFEWPRFKKNQKKERKAFVALMITNVTLAISLVFFPDMPGPTELIDNIFKPFGDLLTNK